MKIETFLNGRGNKNSVSLSNDVYEYDGFFYKKYSVNSFKKAFKNNDISVLTTLKDTSLALGFKKFDDGVATLKVSGVKKTRETISNSQLEKLIETINYFNNLKIEGSTAGFFRAIDLFDKLDYVHEIVPYEKEIIERVRILATKDMVYCHNDLIPDNIFFDGEQVQLIDFEYSGYINYHFDLAILLNGWQFNDEQVEIVLQKYGYYRKINLDNLKDIRIFLYIFWSKLCQYKFYETKKQVYLELYDAISSNLN